jgi:hypothetical protein
MDLGEWWIHVVQGERVFKATIHVVQGERVFKATTPQPIQNPYPQPVTEAPKQL